MTYGQLKDYFDNDTYDELLQLYIPQFDIVDKYAALLQKGDVDNKGSCIKALNELTGVYMDVKKIVEIVEALKTNVELAFYVEKKRELEAKDSKFVSAAVEREASLSIAEYRRIEHIFEAYLSSTLQGIQSIQSILKALTSEYIIESK